MPDMVAVGEGRRGPAKCRVRFLGGKSQGLGVGVVIVGDDGGRRKVVRAESGGEEEAVIAARARQAWT